MNTQRLHLCCGLFAAVWLAILGISGFILDHRDDWRWLWQSGTSPRWWPQPINEKAQAGVIRLYQVSPHDSDIELSGGMTGLWWRVGNQGNWQASHQADADLPAPLIYQILFDEQQVGRVWLATDNGLWTSSDNGRHLTRLAFVGQRVTAIAHDAVHSLYVVIDRSRVYRFDTNIGTVGQLDLRPPARTTLPDAISLSRFTRDLHYGRGVMTVAASLLWNDISGIALLVLPLSGFLFYWLPKRWRRRKAVGAEVNHAYKKQTMRWLFRLHGPSLGLLCFMPLIYLALTGILLDHSSDLRQWMKQTQISRAFQTPVYNIADWQGHIYGVAVKQNINAISLATRLGLFTSVDDGQTWQRQELHQDKAVFVWTLRQQGERMIIGGMGSPNFYQVDDQGAWQKIGGHAHMPSDITLRQDALLLKNRKGLWRMDKDNMAVKEAVSLPVLSYVPWFYVIEGLHSGMLIHAQWKWVNDLMAIITIILVITGLLRWWKTKWI